MLINPRSLAESLKILSLEFLERGGAFWNCNKDNVKPGIRIGDQQIAHLSAIERRDLFCTCNNLHNPRRQSPARAVAKARMDARPTYGWKSRRKSGWLFSLSLSPPLFFSLLLALPARSAHARSQRQYTAPSCVPSYWFRYYRNCNFFCPY